jgi:hypothetical protein
VVPRTSIDLQNTVEKRLSTYEKSFEGGFTNRDLEMSTNANRSVVNDIKFRARSRAESFDDRTTPYGISNHHSFTL